MSYIKYSEARDNWDRSLLQGAYASYFETKLKLLQTQENKTALESMTKAKIWAATINGKQVVLNEEDIAKAATKKISGYVGDIATIYKQTLNAISNAEQTSNQAYQTAAANILRGIQSGQAEGKKFTVDLNSSTALNLAQAAQSLSIHTRGGISNTLGDVGEGVSALAGSAIVDALIEQLESQLQCPGAVDRTTVKAVYKNKGATFDKNYRSQTDNELSISFALNPELTGGQVAVLNFSYNISDKANSALAKLTDKTKSTGSVKLRSSTVKHLLLDANPDGAEEIYNTISYHKDLNEKRYAGMHSSAGSALSAYAGYKLLLETFLESKKHQDEINFTVYGNQIIPENTVVSHMLEKTAVQQLKSGGTRGGRYRYMAEIRYYMLVNGKGENQTSTVNSIEKAEQLIRSMPVQISSSFAFN